jgi:hypothetical protein
MKLSDIVAGLVVIAVAAGILIPTGAVCGRRPKKEIATVQLMNDVIVALQIYKNEYGIYPVVDAFDQLRGQNPKKLKFVDPNHRFMDGWGTALIWRVEPVMELRSAGPDGIAYSKDDLIKNIK